MVVAEVTRMEEEHYRIKAVSQGRQGSWTAWEGVVNQNISWSDLWKIPHARLSFLLLPCPRNLHQWFGNDECCSLCNAPNASLQHILSGCKTTLSQGCYRWRHAQVLGKPAKVLEGCRQGSKESPPAENHISFVTEGRGRRYTGPRETPRPFSPDQERDMRIDLDRQLWEITTTSLSPDIVVRSTKARLVHLIELMTLEEGIEAAFERKKAKYSQLAAEYQ